MTRPIIAIRPEPGLSATLELGRELGLEITGLELSKVEPLSWELPALGAIDALLIGSANAFRFAGEKLDQLQHLPVYAVGKTTAEVAKQAGFSVDKTGTGGLQTLLDELGESRHFLRLAGEERIDLELPAGVHMVERVVYRLTWQAISDDAANLLRSNPITQLYSAGSAQHFAAECDRLRLDRGGISLAALGPRIAEAAGEGWCDIHIAKRPNDAELLAMVRDMCL